uniref:Uncharacterized protein n=1 Tax=Rhizophora mucronata TaxID=61149 RepID=A0A2P2NXN4_RHIMU
MLPAIAFAIKFPKLNTKRWWEWKRSSLHLRFEHPFMVLAMCQK